MMMLVIEIAPPPPGRCVMDEETGACEVTCPHGHTTVVLPLTWDEDAGEGLYSDDLWFCSACAVPTRFGTPEMRIYDVKEAA